MQFTFSKLRQDELSWFISIRNAVRHNLHTTTEYTLADATEWFKHTNLQYFTVSLETKDLPVKKIGYIRLRNLDTQGLAEIGLDLDPKYEGQNLAYLSYIEFAQHLLKKNEIVGLTLRVRKENNRARKLYARLNFEVLGEFSQDGIDDLLLFSPVIKLAQLPT